MDGSQPKENPVIEHAISLIRMELSGTQDEIVRLNAEVAYYKGIVQALTKKPEDHRSSE